MPLPHVRSDNTATVDHVIPLSEGGSNADGNKRVACWGCNHALGTAHEQTKGKKGNRGNRRFKANKAFIKALKKNKAKKR